ncbi:iron-siderophore ABC transporter substrate-binding protein [Promicromonospora citrea]|uniref:ABC transporter substrate-binding protein n=1 Tax=Promicromonospora citrea TaxID=43677 RepID=A0A8H9GPF4_9MICO|nr:iron-siderophore ABC transporter substrate-binding protein [Promicromonospora citrea]NNH52690.1 iron-siderophore ABC transporter substrate-binding protein [Promicromonospora citrea]GGM43979.1 ABC transporter substrate-binding protein [Promicromonospora citrea]HEV6955779.1 iron-siderophore ABC transporter substrate-binding protein [Promicromonospora sp.]
MSLRTTASLAGAALLLLPLLAACGTTDPGAAAPAPSEATSGDCADVETSTGPVTLTDSFGRTVELEQPAERVAVLEWQQTEDLLSLCVTPVAVADVDGYTTWNDAEALPEGTTDVGMRGEPNLDALYATDPDLVVVEAYTPDDEIIAKLEAYDVPVLATKGADAADPIGTMLDTFGLIAQATGRSERADAVAAEFQAHLDEAKALIAEAEPEQTEFVYFDGWVDGGNVSLRPFGQGSLVGELGEEIGLTNAWTGEVDPAYGLGQSDIEGMTAVGDATLVYTGTKEGEDDWTAALTANEVWAGLPAVAEDRAVPFPEHVWTFGGPRSAEKIVDAYVDVFTS